MTIYFIYYLITYSIYVMSKELASLQINKYNLCDGL